MNSFSLPVIRRSTRLRNSLTHANAKRPWIKPRIGRLARLEAGAEKREIECVPADLRTFADANTVTLVKELTAAGLYEDEAQSLADLSKPTSTP